MILIKGLLINEEKLLNAHSVEKDKTNIFFVSAEGNIQTTGITPSDIYKAIEAKENLTKQQADEIKRLNEELVNTEKILLQCQRENDRLRADIKKWTREGDYVELPCENAEKCSDGCLGFRLTQSQISSSSIEDIVCVPTDTCAACEDYFEFCEPAVSNDENGCSGRTLENGELYPKCLACIGIDAGDPEGK